MELPANLDELIDPRTHPIYFQEFEWDIFQTYQHIKTKLFHRHRWVYRLERAPGEVFVVTNSGRVERVLPSGRYCPECKRVEFFRSGYAGGSEDYLEGERWTQKDMISLGLK